MDTDVKNSPWLISSLYLGAMAVLLAIGYMWYGFRWDMTNLAVLVVVAWLLWLQVDRANLLDYAEQATVAADTAADRYDRMAEYIRHLEDRIDILEDRIDQPTVADTAPTGPIIPPTEPMERVWDSAAQQLMWDEAQVTAREVGGRTFRFRNDPS